MRRRFDMIINRGDGTCQVVQDSHARHAAALSTRVEPLRSGCRKESIDTDGPSVIELQRFPSDGGRR